MSYLLNSESSLILLLFNFIPSFISILFSSFWHWSLGQHIACNQGGVKKAPSVNRELSTVQHSASAGFPCSLLSGKWGKDSAGLVLGFRESLGHKVPKHCVDSSPEGGPWAGPLRILETAWDFTFTGSKQAAVLIPWGHKCHGKPGGLTSGGYGTWWAHRYILKAQWKAWRG